MGERAHTLWHRIGLIIGLGAAVVIVKCFLRNPTVQGELSEGSIDNLLIPAAHADVPSCADCGTASGGSVASASSSSSGCSGGGCGGSTGTGGCGTSGCL